MNALVVVYIDQGMHQGKNKVARNEKQTKTYMGFCIQNVWQILKRFAGTFHQA